MSSRKRDSKPKPISKKYAHLIKPIIDQVKKGMNEAYRINVAQFPPQKRQRICDTLKNALKAYDLDYDITMKKGVVYLTFRA